MAKVPKPKVSKATKAKVKKSEHKTTSLLNHPRTTAAANALQISGASIGVGYWSAEQVRNFGQHSRSQKRHKSVNKHRQQVKGYVRKVSNG